MNEASWINASEIYVTLQDDEDTNSSSVFDRIHPLYIAVPFTITYSLIFVAGMVGNVCACIVIIRNKSMHTTTNYYLFSLAVSDLILMLFGPAFYTLLLWCSFYKSVCSITDHIYWLIYIMWTAMYISILTITLFTIERYIAICHPFYSIKISQKKRVLKSIICVWIFAILFEIIYPLFPRSNRRLLAFIIFFIGPLILLTTLCTLMIYNIKKSKTNVRTEENSTEGSNSSDRAFNILVSIIIAFFVCWSPRYILKASPPVSETTFVFFANVARHFYCFSAIVNPILYSVMSSKFRMAFKKTFNQGLQQIYSNSTTSSTPSNTLVLNAQR